MIAKTFEIRDAATFIPVLAVKLEPGNEFDRYLLARAGFGVKAETQAEYVLLCALVGRSECNYDPHKWSGTARTYPVAHEYILEHFDHLPTGSVVDVEFILGLADAPKESERTAR